MQQDSTKNINTHQNSSFTKTVQVDIFPKNKNTINSLNNNYTDTIDHKKMDSLSYFFYNLNTDKPQYDSILFKALNDAPEFYVDSVIAADKKELTTDYDEFKFYMKYKNKPVNNFYSNSTDWISGVLFITVVLILYIRNIKNKFISVLTSSLLQYREFSKNSETANFSDLNFNQLMKLVFALNSSLFIYLTLHFYKLKFIPTTLLFYLGIVLSVIVLLILKELIVRLSGFLLSEKELAHKYIKNIQLFNSILGLIILPFITAIPYISKSLINVLIYSALIIIIGFYTLRVFRFVKIFIDHNVSTLYLILYLCTLEIIPNLLLYKIVQLFYFKMV